MISKPVICQLLHSLNVGGAELLASRLTQHFRNRYRFVFICLDQPGALAEEIRQDGFAVHLVHRKPGFDPSCVYRLAQLFRRERVSLVHAHQYTPFCYGLSARAVSLHLPVLFTEHGRFYPDFPRRRRMLFNRLMLRSQDRVVAVGETVRQALIDNEGIPPHRTSVIYNGIDPRPFAEVRQSERGRLRAELGLSDRDFVAIQVARLDYLKDHITALRVASRMAAQHERFRLVLVGEGPEQLRIEQEIQRRRLELHVQLLGCRRDVPRLLAAADVCLLTSISEGIPLTLLEAMAAGLPIVSTDVGGVREVVGDDGNALLARAGDDQQLAAALLRLAAKPDTRAALVRSGASRIQQLFLETKMCGAYAEYYERMLQD